MQIIKPTETVKNLTVTHVRNDADREYRISTFLAKIAKDEKSRDVWETHVFTLDEQGEIDYGDVLLVKDDSKDSAIHTHEMILKHFDTYQKNFRRRSDATNLQYIPEAAI